MKPNTDFESVAIEALTDLRTTLRGATLAQNPNTDEWEYFMGNLPPHSIKSGQIKEWADGTFNYVFVTAHIAAMTRHGEDGDGYPINCYDMAYRLEMEIKIRR